MISQTELDDIKTVAKELLEKMTIADVEVNIVVEPNQESQDTVVKDVILINITVKEAPFLIGQNGQNLVYLQRILWIILNKKLKKSFYIKLDINNYQKEKVEYLKEMANSAANEVVLLKQQKVLPPMSAYERRLVHEELSHRQDVATESQGSNEERSIVIRPK